MKFLENKSRGIRGEPDSPELWRSILSNRHMRRACKSAKRILVVAGGHGTEVEILVELHGKEILEKIWFNDKYSCFIYAIKYGYI